MDERQQSLDTLKDIRSLMDKSSRFISLSGLSGVAAGTCALIGAMVAKGIFKRHRDTVSVDYLQEGLSGSISISDGMGFALLEVAVITFLVALGSAFFFTWWRSRKEGQKLFGPVSIRLTLALAVPIFIGFLFILRLMQIGAYGFIAPACLLFYGLGLLNASRYTSSEIRYLAYAILAVGTISLYFIGFGLYFWAFGFGVLHILYGIIMWNKYERREIPK